MQIDAIVLPWNFVPVNDVSHREGVSDDFVNLFVFAFGSGGTLCVAFQVRSGLTALQIRMF